MASYKLEMKGIEKAFPGVKALDGVNFELKTGEVHALLGMNGAGKSTLIKILSGIYQKDAGEIFLDGKKIKITRPEDAINKGIATVYQDPQMIPSFTGYENIFLGFESNKRGIFSRVNRQKLLKQAEQLLKHFPVDIDLTKSVNQLKTVEKEIIAILKALSKDMSILVLDEPTSILTEKEKNVLFDLIKMLKQRGISIIYITHRLEEIFEISDRLTIYRDGKNVATLEVKDKETNSGEIAKLIIGEKINKFYPDKGNDFGNEVISVNGLSLEGVFKDVSFRVREGEILGIFGLVGSGIEELSRILFGVYPKTSGIIKIKGQEVNFNSPCQAISHGIFLIPWNRHLEGIFDNQPIYFNISLSNMEKIVSFFGLVQQHKEKQIVEKISDQLKITPVDINQNVFLLSGGNQQKVVIGKGLFVEANTYIFAEPTTGVDVGAKVGIYNLIRKLSRHKAVILISSDCEEVFSMCDHVIVMHKGLVTMHEDVDKVNLEDMFLKGVMG